MYVYTYVYTYVFMYALRAYVCMHVYTYVCIYRRGFVLVRGVCPKKVMSGGFCPGVLSVFHVQCIYGHINVYVCIYIWIYMDIYEYIYIYIYIYIYAIHASAFIQIIIIAIS